MLKKEIKYVDFNDQEQVDTFYFNLNKTEMLNFQIGKEGGLEGSIRFLTETNNSKEVMDVFTEIVKSSVGMKSADGKTFIKSEEITNNFIQSPAFDELFFDLLKDANKMAEFISGIMPKDIRPTKEQYDAEIKKLEAKYNVNTTSQENG